MVRDCRGAALEGTGGWPCLERPPSRRTTCLLHNSGMSSRISLVRSRFASGNPPPGWRYVADDILTWIGRLVLGERHRGKNARRNPVSQLRAAERRSEPEEGHVVPPARSARWVGPPGFAPPGGASPTSPSSPPLDEIPIPQKRRLKEGSALPARQAPSRPTVAAVDISSSRGARAECLRFRRRHRVERAWLSQTTCIPIGASVGASSSRTACANFVSMRSRRSSVRKSRVPT